jgi:hypothetical protein
MILLVFGRKEECLESGIAMPLVLQFGIGFAVAKATSLPATEKMNIVMNRILKEWKGLAVKRPPTDLYNEKPPITISTAIRDRNKTNDE